MQRFSGTSQYARFILDPQGGSIFGQCATSVASVSRAGFRIRRLEDSDARTTPQRNMDQMTVSDPAGFGRETSESG